MKRGWVAGLVGIVVVGAAIAGLVIAVVLTLAAGNDTIVLDLDVGDCFVLPGDADESIDKVEPVDCDDPHDAEVVAVGELNPDADPDYPPDVELLAEADRRCVVAVGDAAFLTEFGIVPVVANEQAWVPKRGRFLCVAIPYGGQLRTGSIDDSGGVSSGSAASLWPPTRAISSVG